MKVQTIDKAYRSYFNFGSSQSRLSATQVGSKRDTVHKNIKKCRKNGFFWMKTVLWKKTWEYRNEDASYDRREGELITKRRKVQNIMFWSSFSHYWPSLRQARSSHTSLARIFLHKSFLRDALSTSTMAVGPRFSSALCAHGGEIWCKYSFCTTLWVTSCDYKVSWLYYFSFFF